MNIRRAQHIKDTQCRLCHGKIDTHGDSLDHEEDYVKEQFYIKDNADKIPENKTKKILLCCLCGKSLTKYTIYACIDVRPREQVFGYTSTDVNDHGTYTPVKLDAVRTTYTGTVVARPEPGMVIQDLDLANMYPDQLRITNPCREISGRTMESRLTTINLDRKDDES